MRVLFDAYWWRAGPPSGRNVLISVVDEWARAFPGDEITLAVPARHVAARSDDHPFPAGARTVPLYLPQHGLSVILELGRKRGHDVVLTQNFTSARSRMLRATFIHDSLFQDRPEWFTPTERRYLSLVPCLARRADLVLTSSEAERARIVAFNPGLAPAAHAVGLGLATAFAQAAPIRPSGALRPQGFVLTVGRLNIRKNVERLVDALRGDRIVSPDFPLVVVGEPDGASGDSSAVDDALADGSMIHTGFVPNGELKWLYQNCAAFVFPSLDEGFGLPVLEAASAGAPMAISRIPAFTEFGDIALFFDPTSSEAMAGAVRSALAGAAPSSARLADQYDWTRTVYAMRALIQAGLRKKAVDA